MNEEDSIIDSDSLACLTDMVLRFRDERQWAQFHNPKDMAISLSLEAAELLELMQWKNGAALEQHLSAKRKETGEELADVLYWTLLIARDLKIDLAAAFKQKMASNALKYPIDKARGSSMKYTELDTGI